jgi:hypothetical protein
MRLASSNVNSGNEAYPLTPATNHPAGVGDFVFALGQVGAVRPQPANTQHAAATAEHAAGAPPPMLHYIGTF